MKNIGIKLLAFVFTLVIISCSKKCDNEQPRARVLNNGTSSVSVGIKTSNGNTVNINNVDPQTGTPNVSYAAGNIVFTITVTVNGKKSDFVKEVAVGNCYDYEISIDSNNVISVKATDRNA